MAKVTVLEYLGIREYESYFNIMDFFSALLLSP
jgi:hypothetical protein